MSHTDTESRPHATRRPEATQTALCAKAATETNKPGAGNQQGDLQTHSTTPPNTSPIDSTRCKQPDTPVNWGEESGKSRHEEWI